MEENYVTLNENYTVTHLNTGNQYLRGIFVTKAAIKDQQEFLLNYNELHTR